MAAQPGVPKISTNLTNEQRVELLLDLARRVELLDALLSMVGTRRRATDTELCMADLDLADLDAMIVL
ncbi:MAG TPA: hypothetical protein VK513_00530 [Terriglobales bacterium]|jgi:hypothetical protein|nr:hypothetical protein [Terriglobales bacterium]